MNRKQALTILELPEEADSATIKAAWRKLSKKYHPDVNPSENGRERFLAVQEAYQRLSGKGERLQPYGSNRRANTQRQRRHQDTKNRMRLLVRVNKYLGLFSILFFIFNLLLIIDWVLPTEQLNGSQPVVARVITSDLDGDPFHIYDQVIVKDLEVFVAPESIQQDIAYDSAVLTTTFLLGEPIWLFLYSTGGKQKFAVVFSMYQSFKWLMPIILLLIMLFFRLNREESRLSVGLLLLLAGLFQLVVYWSY